MTVSWHSSRLEKHTFKTIVIKFILSFINQLFSKLGISFGVILITRKSLSVFHVLTTKEFRAEQVNLVFILIRKYKKIWTLFKRSGVVTKVLDCNSIVYIYVFTNTIGYDTRSIFKRGLTDSNAEFFFSQTGCLTKAKELSLPNYLTIAGGRIISFISFPRIQG